MKIIIRSIVENLLSGTKADLKAILNCEHAIERKKMDHQKSKSTFSAILMSLTLMVAALGVSSAVAAEKEMVKDPSTGKMVEKPRYGGSLTFVRRNEGSGVDAWSCCFWMASAVVEKLSIVDWAIDREKYPFMTGYVPPLFAQRPALAESWEQPDPLTYVFHIRPGVRWHDKAPMNGRALTAKDVEYNYHRLLGMGKFTEKSPSAGALGALPFESIEATDDMTVVFKLTEPRVLAAQLIMQWYSLAIQPPEVIEEKGAIDNWQDLVGTGPYMMVDWVRGSSFTFEKNPDYWGFDEKYPENRLPYIDRVMALVMPEAPTILAALRSGQVDYVGWHGSAQLQTVDEADSLRRTDPQLVIYTWAERSNAALQMNTNTPPFDDIRVRQAMQNALDLETMNRTYFKGQADITPRGMVDPGFAAQGMTVPYEEWSAELKAKYAYDPELAKRLLDEASYPRGADGVRFQVDMTHLELFDTSFMELQAAYWAEIGVQVNVVSTPLADFLAARVSGDYEMRTQMMGVKADPLISSLPELYRKAGLESVGAEFDALYDRALTAKDIDEAAVFVKQMDMMVIENQWLLWGALAPVFTVHWPWVKGYAGEHGLYGGDQHAIFARLWIDQELKTEMGY